MNECVRLCFPCRVQWRTRWSPDPDGIDERSCPRCGSEAFWTCNAGDLGTAMALHKEGLSMSDFEEVSLPPADGEQSKETDDDR